MIASTAAARALLARSVRRLGGQLAELRAPRKALAGISLVVALSLSTTSGTAALWTGSVAVPAPAIMSGSISAVLGDMSSLGTTFNSGALAKTGSVVLSNDGTVEAAFATAVSLSATSSTSLADATTITVWESTGSCGAATLPSSPSIGTWESFPVLTGTLPAGGSRTYCVRTRMAASHLTTTASVTPTLTLDLTVPGTTWASSASASVTQKVVADAAVGNDYTDTVRADGAQHYWRLGEPSGRILYDWVGVDDAYAPSNTTLARGTGGALLGDVNTATTFPNDGSGMAGTRTRTSGQQSFAVEAWFQTTSTSGGKIVGFGNYSSGLSSSYDRHIYLDAAGLVHFGVYPGTQSRLVTTTAYNDGQWHHVVGNLGAGGQQLYVDGALVASSTNTSAQSYSGYWRIGGDTPWAGDAYFDGVIDDVAVYGDPLSARAVENHWNLSGRGGYPLSAADQYGSTVYADSPTIFWRFGESAGTVAADSGLNGNAGTYSGSVTKPVTGAVPRTRDSAASFNGTDGLVSSNTMFTNPQTYSIELWFKTTSTTGGKLIGFGNSQTGSSTRYDRHIYLQNDGAIRFGTHPDSAQTVMSAPGYNDGSWHHVVATQSSAGMLLYVDGTAVDWDSRHTTSEVFDGYWRVGGDNLSGWPGAPTTFHVTSQIDEVAVYGTALSERQIKEHFAAATGAPIASYTASMSGLSGSFNATSSSDFDGSITGYSWNFGDGSAAAAGATATHTFGATGYYIVGLTVTDDSGKTSTSYNIVYARDTAAPSTPGTPTVTVNDGAKVRITWNASTDDAGVTRYDVYRNGVKIAESTDNIHTDNTVAVGTTYTYAVRAVDGTGNQSATSGSVTVTTLAVDTVSWHQVRTYSHSKCLTFTGTATSTILTQYGCGTYAANNQNFRFEHVANGYYRVVFRAATGTVWDLPSSSTTDGTDIHLWTSHNGSNQQWLPTKLANGSYTFTVQASGKCLDLSGGNSADGTALQQWTCNSTNANQMFTLVKVP